MCKLCHSHVYCPLLGNCDTILPFQGRFMWQKYAISCTEVTQYHLQCTELDYSISKWGFLGRVGVGSNVLLSVSENRGLM
jgi:hypothetical protein